LSSENLLGLTLGDSTSLQSLLFSSTTFGGSQVTLAMPASAAGSNLCYTFVLASCKRETKVGVELK